MITFEEFFLLEGAKLPGEFKFGFELEAIAAEGDYNNNDEDYDEAISQWVEDNWSEEYNDVIDDLVRENSKEFKDAIEEIEDEMYDLKIEIEDTEDEISKLTNKIGPESSKVKKQGNLFKDEPDEIKNDDVVKIEELQKKLDELKEKMTELEDNKKYNEEEIEALKESDEITNMASEITTENLYQMAYENVDRQSQGGELLDRDKDNLLEYFDNFFDEEDQSGEIKGDSTVKPDHRGGGSFEYNSPILQMSPKNLQGMFRMLDSLKDKDIYTNETCGFHVHISFPDISLEDTMWISAHLAVDEPAKDKFIYGKNNTGVSFFSSEYASAKYLDSIKRYFDNKEYEYVFKTLLDNQRYKVINVNSHGTMEWRGPRNFINGNETKKIKDFILLLRQFITWMSDAMDKKDLPGTSINRQKFSGMLKQYQEIYTSKKGIFQKKYDKLSHLSVEEKRLISVHHPWMFKLNFTSTNITVTKDSLRMYGGIIRDGVWKYGDLEKCSITGVTLMAGELSDCRFNNCTCKGAKINGQPTIFSNGVFEKGYFEGKGFNNSVFKGGTYDDGNFLNSTFKDGIWQGGDWLYGNQWLGGQWKEGNIYFSYKNEVWFSKTNLNPYQFFKTVKFSTLENKYVAKIYNNVDDKFIKMRD